MSHLHRRRFLVQRHKKTYAGTHTFSKLLWELKPKRTFSETVSLQQSLVNVQQSLLNLQQWLLNVQQWLLSMRGNGDWERGLFIYAAQVGTTLSVCLLQAQECWDYRCAWPHPALDSLLRIHSVSGEGLPWASHQTRRAVSSRQGCRLFSQPSSTSWHH